MGLGGKNFFKSEASEARQAVGKLREGSLWASLEYVGNGFIVIHIFGLVHRDAGMTTYLESTAGGEGQSPIGFGMGLYQIAAFLPILP